MYNTLKNHIITYPTPQNITYFWSFGFLAGFMLVNQILTGLFLADWYKYHRLITWFVFQ